MTRSNSDFETLLAQPRLLLRHTSRDPERFAALFREVWGRVPEPDREILARGWSGRSGRAPARVELLDLANRGVDVSTDVDEFGRVLRFDPSLFDGAPPTVVRGGIAFVLACASICMKEETERLNELFDFIAFSYAGDWGFPLSSKDDRVMERWLRRRLATHGPSGRSDLPDE